jgi:predicted nucleic acid-binding protein
MLDTSFIIYYLHAVEPYASKARDLLARETDLAISLKIIDEILYTLIRLEAWRRLGIRRAEDLRQYVRRNGMSSFKETANNVRNFIEKLGIDVLEDKGSAEEIIEAMFSYSLLSGDALVAVSCRNYGINTIATFDEYFKRVPWLKVVP